MAASQLGRDGGKHAVADSIVVKNHNQKWAWSYIAKIVH